MLPNLAGAPVALSHVGILAAMIFAIKIVVITGHLLLAAHARDFLGMPCVIRAINRVAGCLMIGIGVVVAATR